jgi:hypothetical protein
MQAWLVAVPGLTVPQQSALAKIMAEDEYSGEDLIGLITRIDEAVLSFCTVGNFAIVHRNSLHKRDRLTMVE